MARLTLSKNSLVFDPFGFLFIGELLGPDLTATLVSLVNAKETLGSKDFVFSSIANGLELLSFLTCHNGEDSARGLMASSCGLQLLGRRVVDQTSLGFALTLGEEDELRLVSVQSVDVELELLLTCVGSSVVNGDANGACEMSIQTCLLKFVKGEAAAVSHLACVLSCSGRNDRAEFLDRAREAVGRLCDSTLVSHKLLSWLIEVALGSAVPVLAQVDVRYGVVVLDHC